LAGDDNEICAFPLRRGRLFLTFLFFNVADFSVARPFLIPLYRRVFFPRVELHFAARAQISFSLSLFLSRAARRTLLVSRCLVRFPRSYNAREMSAARVPRRALRRVYFYQRKCVVVRARIPARRLPGKGDAGGTRASRDAHLLLSPVGVAHPRRDPESALNQ